MYVIIELAIRKHDIASLEKIYGYFRPSWIETGNYIYRNYSEEQVLIYLSDNLLFLLLKKCLNFQYKLLFLIL